MFTIFMFAFVMLNVSFVPYIFLQHIFSNQFDQLIKFQRKIYQVADAKSTRFSFVIYESQKRF